MSLTTLAFHAEKLHQSQVWQKVYLAARLLAKHGIQGTFFVYPFPAAVYGEDIRSRVRTLAALGHEIAQHTHFYAGSQIDKCHKVDDLSRKNIADCLRRDFDALNAMGCAPRGFTAGSWFIGESLFQELVDLGFIYDCSARSPRPKPPATPDPRAQWLSSPQTFRNQRGQLLRLPTTCSLGEWFKWGYRRIDDDARSPRIVYLHDFDLLRLHGRLMLTCFLRLIRSDGFATTANVAGQYLESVGAPACRS